MYLLGVVALPAAKIAFAASRLDATQRVLFVLTCSLRSSPASPSRAMGLQGTVQLVVLAALMFHAINPLAQLAHANPSDLPTRERRREMGGSTDTDQRSGPETGVCGR